MIYLDIDTCTEAQYSELLKYIFNICNKVSFHFPNFENTYESPRKIKYKNNGSLNEEYVRYLKKNEEIISLCLNAGAKKYMANDYVGYSFRYNTQVIVSKLLPEIKKLIKMHHIFDWQYPALPEDLCFYEDETCRFGSIAHEREFVIYHETSSDISFLTSKQFKFIRQRG